MAKTLKVTKGNVQTLVRRGVIPANVAKQVQGGATVSINYEGNLVSSFRPQSMTVDGQTTSFGRGFEPERQRRTTKPRQEREQFISTRQDGAVTMSQADIQEMTRPRVAPQPRGGLAARDGITAKQIFTQAKQKGLTVEEYVGAGPVYRGREIDGRMEYTPVGGRGVGFAPTQERISERIGEKARLQEFEEKEFAKPQKVQEEPRGYRDRVFGKVEQFIQKARTAPTASDILREKTGVQGFKFKVPGMKGQDVGKEILSGIIFEGVQATKMVAYPKQTVIGFKELGKTAISQPLETSAKQVISAVHGSIKAEGLPFTIGRGVTQYYGAKGLGVVSKGAYARSPIKIVTGKVKVPIKGGQLRTIWKGASVEYFKRGQPLIGVSRKKVVVGTPKVGKIYLEAGGKKGYLPVSPTEASVIRKKLPELYGPKEVAKIDKGLIVMRATEKTKSAFVKAQFNKQLKALSPKGVKQVLKFAEQEEGLVYGSFGARQQMPKSRVPGDIDLQLGVGQQEAIVKTQQLAKRLQAVGEKVRVSKKTPTLIEAVKGKEIHHAVDIHSIESSLTGSASQAGEGVWGLSFGQKPVKIEGVRVMPLSEQGLRKGEGIFQLRAEGLGARPHRLKDIPDFFSTQEVLIESKWFGKTKLRKTLGELKELYPQEVFKDTATSQNPMKVLLQAPKTTKPSTFFKATRPSPAIGIKMTKPSSPAVLIKTKSPSIRLPSEFRAGRSPSIYRGPSPSGRLPSPKVYGVGSPSPRIPSEYKIGKGPSPKIPSEYKIGKGPSPKIPSVYKAPSPSPYGIPSPKAYTPRSPSPYLYPFSFPRSPPPKVPRGSFEGILEGKAKKPRELARVFKYKPTLIAVEKNIKGKAPEIITGLEVRPL